MADPETNSSLDVGTLIDGLLQGDTCDAFAASMAAEFGGSGQLAVTDGDGSDILTAIPATD